MITRHKHKNDKKMMMIISNKKTGWTIDNKELFMSNRKGNNSTSQLNSYRKILSLPNEGNLLSATLQSTSYNNSRNIPSGIGVGWSNTKSVLEYEKILSHSETSLARTFYHIFKKKTTQDNQGEKKRKSRNVDNMENLCIPRTILEDIPMKHLNEKDVDKMKYHHKEYVKPLQNKFSLMNKKIDYLQNVLDYTYPKIFIKKIQILSNSTKKIAKLSKMKHSYMRYNIKNNNDDILKENRRKLTEPLMIIKYEICHNR